MGRCRPYCRDHGGLRTTGHGEATEAAYRRLRQDFLFRPRGSFYLPNVGVAQTFVLAGRL